MEREPGQTLHGNHGYDPATVESMRGTFIAHGASFRRAYHFDGFFHVIDTYSLLCYLLRLKPRAHDGLFARVKHMLSEARLDADAEFLREHFDDDEFFLRQVLLGGALLILVSLAIPVITFWRRRSSIKND